MKERPILFTPENAQKCHVGAKTQTRRIVKDYEFYACLTGDCPHWDKKLCAEAMAKECPYGQVGDRLWVREAHSPTREGGYIYKGWPMFKDADAVDWKWTPSLHMPRKACRTVLEITEIRVERVQEISHEDAVREGCNGQGWKTSDDQTPIIYPAHEFKALWESINGKGSWAINPFVWVIEFKKVPA